MVADSGRIDKKSIVDGPAIIAAPEDFVFVGPFKAVSVKGGTTSQALSPFGLGSGFGDGGGDDGPGDPGTEDVPQLTDIEKVEYEQYFDSFNSIRFNAIVTIRNSSKRKSDVIAVDARNKPKGA
jgi:hypothetical protein